MKRRYLYLPLAAGILTPSLVIFVLQVFIAKISPFKSILDILQRQFSKGDILFLLMVMSFIPFGLLMILTYSLEFRIKKMRLAFIFWGGFIPVLLFTVFIHISVWYPIYAPHTDSSSTGSLAFLLLPVMGPILLAIGSLIGWGVSYFPMFKKK
jgi:hypothetical protein